MRPWILTATVLATALALTGCSVAAPTPPTTHPATRLTWQRAKADTQATETEIAKSIDPSAVASITQTPKGTLLRCDANTWQWTGHTKIALKTPTSPESYLATIKSSWAPDHGFESRMIPDAIGGQANALQLHRGTAEGYTISGTAGNAGLQIDSFSPCFTVPDDVYPGGSF